MRMTLTTKLSAAAVIIGFSLLAVGIVFLGNQRLAHGLDSPFLPFDDPPSGSQILCYLNNLEFVNGVPILHPPIPIFDVGECAGPDITECSNAIDDDGDGLIDLSDPACHSDGNAGNPSSYDPTHDDESDFVSQCRDGIDNDGDGKTDFPTDPGCASQGDNSETDGSAGGGGPEDTLALCSDSADNDGDSLIDLLDPDCEEFQPKLVVLKLVVNDNSGTSTVSDFSLFIGTTTSATTSVSSGATTTVAVDSWNVGELQKAGYTATFGGDCNGAGVVSLGIGQTKTCRISNNDVAPGALACADGMDNDGDGLVDSADPGCHTDGNASNGGSYDPTDNSETNSGGGGGGGGGGGSATTTGTLVVNKVFASGTTTPDLFSFTINGASTTAFASSSQNILTVTTGTYTVLEVATSSYTASYTNCSAISVSSGATTTCTITNTLAATSSTMGNLVIQKVFGSGTTSPTLFSFSLNGAATTTFDADVQNDLLVATGTYNILEAATSTYNVSYSNCSGIHVVAGTTTMCVITNTLATSTPSGTGGPNVLTELITTTMALLISLRIQVAPMQTILNPVSQAAGVAAALRPLRVPQGKQAQG